jgi:hypothetical protein
MKSKFMLLALSVFALAFAALPALASAGEPVIDPSTGKFPLPFTSVGGHGELRAEGEPPITCTSNSGTGEYTSGTTGKIGLTFKGCTTSFFGFPVSCKSSGAESGVVVTNSSVFHTTYLTDAKTTPGVLVTPPTGGIFATIICGGFATISVEGNGIIGHLEAPKCGGKSKTATLNFTATGASQTFQQVTATGTSYSLISHTESGEEKAVPAAEVAEGTVTYNNNAEATLTCL